MKKVRDPYAKRISDIAEVLSATADVVTVVTKSDSITQKEVGVSLEDVLNVPIGGAMVIFPIQPDASILSYLPLEIPQESRRKVTNPCI